MTVSSSFSDKAKLLNHLKSIIAARIAEAKKAIEATIVSRDSDSKSTAGDKHEVGRAMIQIELDNQSLQLAKNKMLLEQLEMIRLDRTCDEVGFGNLVKTNSGTYFISIGIGQVELDGSRYFVISRESPIGQAMEGKKVKDEFSFNERNLRILTIS